MILSKKLALMCAAVLLLAGSAAPCAGQELPVFGRSPEYKTGRLPNGVEYIMVASQASKGKADFALVQMGAGDEGAASRALSSLPHFTVPSPARYLLGHGVLPGADGYAFRTGGALVYGFKDVPVYDKSLRDSTLLLICDLMETHPLSQTLIVAGDIAPGDLAGSLYMLSLSVPARAGAPAVQDKQWQKHDVRKVSIRHIPSAEQAELSLVFSTPSTPRSELGSSIPLVSRKYTDIMGIILTRRLRDAFMVAGIACSGLDFITRTILSEGEVQYGLNLRTSPGNVSDAMKLCARVMSELDNYGATVEEFSAASRMVSSAAALAVGNTVPSNAEYVRRCVDAALFGASLASDDEVNAFVAQQVLAPETEQPLFNRYASALLDREDGLAMHFSIPGVGFDTDEAIAAFDSGWQEAAQAGESVATWHPAKGFDELKPSRRKVKRKAIIQDPVTSGETWTYSNGMRVIFKKTSTRGLVHFAFVLNGGYSSIQGLAAGEERSLQDALELYSIAGVPLADARDMLAAEGVSIDARLTSSALTVSGYAPAGKMKLVMDFIESLAYHRSPRKDKLEKYLDRQFQKCADGALILIGDMDRIDTEDLMKARLGVFTCNKQYAARPVVTRSYPHTWRTETVTGRSDAGSVSMSFAAPLPYSQESVATAGIASIILENRLAAALIGLGMRAECRLESSVSPIEMASLEIKLSHSDLGGLPAESRAAALEEGLVAARAAIASVRSVSEAEFEFARRAYLDKALSNIGREEFLLGAAIMRSTHGRDMVTGITGRIEALDKGEVEALVGSLCASTRLEIISK